MKNWPENFVDLFWQAYPRRVAKKAAARALEKVRASGDVSFEHLMIGVRSYAAAVRGKDLQYVCHPATWLHGERWTDDPDAIVGKPATVADVFARLCGEEGEDFGGMFPQIGRH